MVARRTTKLLDGLSSSCCDAFGLLIFDNASVVLVLGNRVVLEVSVN